VRVCKAAGRADCAFNGAVMRTVLSSWEPCSTFGGGRSSRRPCVFSSGICARPRLTMTPTRVPRPPTLVQHFTASLSRRLVGVRLGRYVYVRCPARARLLWRRPCVVQPAPRTFLLGKLKTGCAATVQLPGCQPSDSACFPAISSFPPRPPAPAVPAAQHDVCDDGGPKHVCDGPFCAGQ